MKPIFWVFFVQTILPYVVCTYSIRSDPLRFLLHRAYGQKFWPLIMQNTIVVWKITKDFESKMANHTLKPEDYSSRFTVFQPDEMYLIFTRIKDTVFHTYYWMGHATSLADKKRAAKNAIIFYHYLFSKYYNCYIKGIDVNMSRESEMLESDSFHHTMSILSGKPYHGRTTEFRDSSVPLPGPHLYVVKGGTTHGGSPTTRVKKVTISLDWLRPDVCLLLETGPTSERKLDPVTIYCGDKTNTLIQERTLRLGLEMISVCKIESKESDRYNSLVELLKEGYNRPTDVDTSDDHLKDGETFVKVRDEVVYLFRIENEKVRTKIPDQPISIHNFNAYENYLLDTDSIGGLLFIPGNKADVDAKVAAIVNAEQYLHDEMLSVGKPLVMKISSTPSTIDLSDYVVFDLDINLIERPYKEMMFVLKKTW